MAEKFEEKYGDVLQNIEAIIVSVHKIEPGLLDYDVEAVLEALISRYGAEARGRAAREQALEGLRGKLYDALLPILEWRIGRADLGHGKIRIRVQRYPRQRIQGRKEVLITGSRYSPLNFNISCR